MATLNIKWLASSLRHCHTYHGDDGDDHGDHDDYGDHGDDGLSALFVIVILIMVKTNGKTSSAGPAPLDGDNEEYDLVALLSSRCSPP